ncbi:MAG: SGNH/GDSL hydrolase family protein [Deltaproteobacteria bacterium]|nr:SGNH/GDSL hydrolase family protein [Deltaproteobacteria bacterium]MBI3293315.1 SGNH/GDSL hydrolase family protein [Deltaproteobacteria bacterium]
MKRLVTILSLAIMAGFFTELAARIGVTISLGWSAVSTKLMRHPEELWFSYYPELRRILAAPGEAAPRVLLVGASVIAGGRGYGSVVDRLREEGRRAGVEISIANAGVPAHTSVDALFKYRLLGERRFDLVIWSEGFNEVRANNCPDGDFRSDYSHYSWYRRLRVLERHPELKFIALPYVVDSLVEEARHLLSGHRDLPRHAPVAEYHRYGEKVKTTLSLEKNLEAFLGVARQRGEAVVVVTQPFFIPPDYSLERFQGRALDYNSHVLPVELWGSVEGVRAGAEAHNEAIRRVAARARERGQDVKLIDLATLLTGGRKYFNDVCHLTDEGSRVFARQILNAWERARLARERSSPVQKAPHS